AATATALEALYGVDTGIDLGQMLPLARLAESLVGWPIPWNEPVVGSGVFEQAWSDEYEMEADVDRLVHGSLEPSLVGGRRIRQISFSTGPFGMWAKLRD